MKGMRGLFLMIFVLGAVSSAADNRDSVKGYWASPGSIFEVYERDGSLYGQIRVLKDPYYLPEEVPGLSGKPRTDRLNPDPDLQSVPLIGLHMFSAYEFKDGQWQGLIYDPESGKTYKSRMKVNAEGELEIRGYVGVPMFGRTARFLPVESCDEHIVEMLSDLPGVDAC